ncbi:MAG: pyridoxamine kinase [Lachnospiraceae bacterium]|nr:pyridoxamine kinase [Lachnospiraceae bacterium]
MKRILTIQDISCFGKCSTTIALPVLSVMGIETVILPTALFSMHTLFKDVYRRDLSYEMERIAERWERENIHFDAIYTAYLGSVDETEIVMDMIRRFKRDNTLVFVDPVMGDNGRFYTGFDQTYAEKTRELCALADVAVPNVTESCFLTGYPYSEQQDIEQIRELLNGLRDMGIAGPVITGINTAPDRIAVAGFGSELFIKEYERIPASYHGTGDIFSSVCIGSILNGKSPAEAVDAAAGYVAETIKATMEQGGDPRYGVAFEKTLPLLTLGDGVRVSK